MPKHPYAFNRLPRDFFAPAPRPWGEREEGEPRTPADALIARCGVTPRAGGRVFVCPDCRAALRDYETLARAGEPADSPGVCGRAFIPQEEQPS